MHCQWRGIDFVPGLLAFSNLILCHKAFFFCLKAHRSPENMNFLWLFALTQRAYSINSNLKACQLPLQLITCEQLKLLNISKFSKEPHCKNMLQNSVFIEHMMIMGKKEKEVGFVVVAKDRQLIREFLFLLFFPGGLEWWLTRLRTYLFVWQRSVPLQKSHLKSVLLSQCYSTLWATRDLHEIKLDSFTVTCTPVASVGSMAETGHV